MRRIKKYNALPKNEQKLFWQAIIYTIYLTPLSWLPLNKLHHYLGKADVESPTNTNIDENILLQIKNTLRRVIKHTPFPIKCFAQALIAKKMLSDRKIQSTLYLGVAKINNKLHAHAWLRAGNIIITGGKTTHKFKIVKHFS